MSVMTTVQQILSDQSLVPWIEERAFRFSMHRFVMAQRVQVFTDMTGWNVRKVSNYLRPKGAHLLEEGEEIPASRLERKRLAEIEPTEWGDRYPITNRRSSTDPEAVLSDTVEFLGYQMGRKREQLLFQAALEAAELSGLKFVVEDEYTLDLPVELQTYFEANAFNGQIYHVIHPYQERAVKLELLNLSNPAVPEFRNRFIRQWSYGGFGGLNIAVSSMVPRKVKKRLVLTGAEVGDTFRLRFGLEDTDEIKIVEDSGSPDVAQLVADIKSALEALDSVGDATVTVTNDDGLDSILIEVDKYVDEEMQLTVGYEDGSEAVDVSGVFRIEEVSGKARAPFLQPQAVVYDIRQRLTVYQEWKPAYRTLDIGGYEVYGVGPWNYERSAYIETEATSPFAVS